MLRSFCRLPILEDDTRADEREEVVRIEPAPGALRSLQQLERHRQSGGARAGPLGHSRAERHRGESGLNRVGAPEMFSVRGRELEVRQEPAHVSDQRLHGFGILRLIVLGELVYRALADGPALRIHHLV